MAFYGTYNAAVKNKKIHLSFAFGNEPYEVMCIEDAGIWVNISPYGMDVEGKACFKIIESKSMIITNEFELPKAFYEFINGDKEVRVIGVGNRVEIYKKEYADELMENMTCDDKLIDTIEKLGLDL